MYCATTPQMGGRRREVYGEGFPSCFDVLVSVAITDLGGVGIQSNFFVDVVVVIGALNLLLLLLVDNFFDGLLLLLKFFVLMLLWFYGDQSRVASRRSAVASF